MTELSFVSDLYRNVLFREPDTAGANYWVNQLTLGGASRDTVRAAFLNSPEADTYVNPIIRLYENILGRAPDAAGLNAWSQALRGGSQSLAQITAGFLNSAEGQAAGWSGPGVTGQAFITKLYTAMGRTAEQVAADPGAAAWANALNTGRISPADVAVGINESAENKASSAGFVTGYEALRAVGITNPTTAQAQAFSNTATTAQILSSASTVTGTTLPTGPGVTPEGGAIVGQTFTLTDKLDTITNAGAVNGVIGGADQTWGVADQIASSGKGVFNATAIVGGAVTTAGRTISGFETVNINFIDADTGNPHTLTVDNSTLGAVKNYVITNAVASANDAVSFTGLTKTQTVTIRGTDADLDVNLSYKTDEDATTADTATLAVNGARADVVTVNGAFETVKITGTNASTVAQVNAAGNGMTKLEIDGAGATTINSVTGFSATAAALSIDASKATGNVTIGTELNNKFTITGGTGTGDTVLATNTAGSTISSSIKLTGVENLIFVENGTGSALTHSVDLTNSTGVTTVGLRGSTTSNADTVTFNNLAAASTVLLQGSKTAANQTVGSVTATVKGATSSAPAESMKVVINNQGTDTGVTGTTENTISAGTVTLNNVKAISVEASDGDVAALTLSADKMTTLTVKGTEDVIFASTVGAAAETTTINASEVAGSARFTLVNNLAKDVVVTSGAGADRITLGDQGQNGTADTTISINTGAGNDQFTTGEVSNKAVLKADLGAGDDKVIVTDNKSIATAKDHVINYGEGVDTLEFAGSTATNISTVSHVGLEKVLISGSADLSVQAASFSGSTIEVTTIGSGRLNLAGTTGADTIDASKLVIVGPNGVKVTGGQGADTITLTSGTTTADIVNYTAKNEFGDTVTGFNAGAGPDTVNFAAALLVNGTPSATLVSASAATWNGTNTTVGANSVFVEITDAQTTAAASTAAGVAGLLTGAQTNIADGDKIAIALTDGTDTYVWYWEASSTNATVIDVNELTLAVRLVGVTDVANGDFTFA